jgi:hypothetical protein
MQLPQTDRSRDDYNAAIDDSGCAFHGGMAEEELAGPATLPFASIVMGCRSTRCAHARMSIRAVSQPVSVT